MDKQQVKRPLTSLHLTSQNPEWSPHRHRNYSGPKLCSCKLWYNGIMVITDCNLYCSKSAFKNQYGLKGLHEVDTINREFPAQGQLLGAAGAQRERGKPPPVNCFVLN